MGSSKITKPNEISNDYGSQTTISNNSSVSADGLLTFTLEVTDAWGYAEVKVNNSVIAKNQNDATARFKSIYGNLRVKKGDRVGWGNANNGSTSVKFLPYT